MIGSAGGLRFDRPPGYVPRPVPYCVLLTGTGKIPPGYAFLIFDRAPDDPADRDLNDDTQAQQGPGETRWSAQTEVGTPGSSGEQAVISAALLPQDAADLLIHQAALARGIVKELPPPALIADSITVVRNDVKTPCHQPPPQRGPAHKRP